MLALVVRFMAMPDKQQLSNFLRAKPEAISVPFISWIADQEANAVGEQKRVLAGICEELVLFREQLEEQRLESLYAGTLAALSEGEADPGSAALALAASPAQYATRLAEALTGAPVATDGYDPVYDVLLKVVPPAALTPEGVRQGHERARELAEDLRARRKRSVQSMIGRAQLTPEQADQLMAGSYASRILDMLLQLPSTADRLACLPDCFTPPPAEDGQTAVPTGAAPGPGPTPPPPGGAPPTPTPASTSTSSPASGSGSGSGPGAGEELVWCTPSQLLVELEARLQRLEGRGPRPPPGGELPAPQGAGRGGPGSGSGGSGGPAGQQQLVGEALVGELRVLREEVRRTWLESLDAAAGR